MIEEISMSKNRFTLPFLALVLAAGPMLYSQEAAPEAPEATEALSGLVGGGLRHPIMHMNHAALERRKFAYENAPRMAFDPNVHYMLRQARAVGATASANLLSYFAYTPSSWNQQSCGDCWVWAGTAASSIDMAVNGKKDLLSVQYFNSGYNNGTGNNWAGCGGIQDEFAAWYSSHKQFIPVGNANAAFADGNQGCPGSTKVQFSSIDTAQKYPFTSITNKVVTTLNVGQSTAIANVKNMLNQNKAVMFGFYLPTAAGWTDFENYWNGKTEKDVFQIDKYNGQTWVSGDGGGHEVTIVGYDDSDSSWIVLNSWGTTSGRPNGLWKIPQAMNYDTYFVDGGTQYHSFDFEVFDIVWPTSSNTVSASINTPASDITVATGSNQNFVGTATDSASGATMTYSWNFGDGGTGTGASATHTFTNTSSSPVTYSVVLTATDNTGAKGTATRKVTVNPGTTPGNTVTAAISTPSSNVTLATGTAQNFVGSAVDSSSGATLSYAWAFGDGATATGATASHTYTNTGSSAATYTATLTATDNTGAKGTATRTITVNPSGGSGGGDLIVNGGFESGSTGWRASSGTIGAFSERPAYAGSRCAWLCGYGSYSNDVIYQVVTIPSTAASATLSFALHIDSGETTTTKAYDRLSVSLKSASGANLKTLGVFSNLDKASGYAIKTFDVSAFKGQKVVVYFQGTEDRDTQTSFVIDNVSLTTK